MCCFVFFVVLKGHFYYFGEYQSNQDQDYPQAILNFVIDILTVVAHSKTQKNGLTSKSNSKDNFYYAFV